MDTEKNQQQIKTIYRMLLEIASGNLAFRILPDGSDKTFDELVTLLNEFTEKMQSANYVHPWHNCSAPVSRDDPATTIIHKVQDYILNHLEEPLPSSKELSKMFGTNEFTLKENFRKILKTSIYQFYNDERLKKAHFLIQQTVIPLKEIAFLCGFNEYTNFFKAFKKKYNYSPSDVNRTESSTDSAD